MSAIPPATNAFVPFMTDINNAPVFKPTANYGFYPSMPMGNAAAPQASMIQKQPMVATKPYMPAYDYGSTQASSAQNTSAEFLPFARS